MREGYDVAQICLNGHVIISESMLSACFKSDFCRKCGQPTITTCPHCNTSIRGEYQVPGVISTFSRFILPSFCHSCGKPYPWTEAKIKAAQELAEEMEGLSEDQRVILKRSIDDIVADTSQGHREARGILIANPVVRSDSEQRRIPGDPAW